MNPRPKLALIALTGLAAAVLSAPGRYGQGGMAGARPRAIAGTLLIGHLASLTGAIAAFGQATERGARLAENQINQGGSLSVKMITIDDAGDKAQVAPLLTRLIAEHGIHAIVGEVASSLSIAAAPVADARQVPMVSPSSTHPDVTVDPRTRRIRPYVFRACFTERIQGAVMARFVHENLKLSRAALLVDHLNAYSVRLADGFKQRFTKARGRIVATEVYAEGDQDFRGQLGRIRDRRPQVLVVPGYYNSANRIVRQARQLGLKMPILGGDGWDSPTLAKGAEGFFTHCYFTNHFSPDVEQPRVQEFVRAYRARFDGETPNALAALGYDAVMLVADAAKRAGRIERPALRDALEATKQFPAVSGPITVGRNHDAIKPGVVLRVTATGKGITLRPVATVAP